ncbi:pirin family protein [Idiomarina abyssalis]|uniref:Pirin family protein n=1 Tax=Idiomarina abyssalis TaxID=86102 RepID=A0A8I1G448_9GAMM|nr:pirin family protein [Idiomarina abyssalis]MBJ7266545.1 pirin family protein [Idiomarina abyssalis]MBJ7272957.1 pirin family protein [Idiomarina abyssalis]MBJ7315384.1 pirin family protein [Idiomarina abyssalis]
MSAILAKHRGMPAQDGAGVKLTRIINQPGLKHQDPFLMLDEFRSDNPDDYIAGFPPHPHRGFCTLTYMLAGTMEHKDSVGNTGAVEAGGVQWMKAAKGIIHAEMPKQVEGLMWGFQLWVNLPSDEKMSEPDWHDFPSATIPEVKSDDALVRVISGQYQQQEGPVRAPGRDFLMLDVHLGKEAFSLPSQGQKRRLLYVYQGGLTVNGELAKEGELLVLDPADTLTCTADEGARFILLAAKPIEEPIAQYGPFVMNNSGEIEQAIKDYQAGTLAANQKLS